MAEPQLEQVAPRMIQQPVDDAVRERAARAPDEMKSRHGIAGHVQAALDPHRHRHELDAERGQPFVDVRHAAFDISPRPGPRPFVSRSELAEGEPVGESELDAVPDSATPLQRRAGEPEPAECVSSPGRRGFPRGPGRAGSPGGRGRAPRWRRRSPRFPRRRSRRRPEWRSDDHDGVYSARKRTRGEDMNSRSLRASPDRGVAGRLSSDDECPGAGRAGYEERARAARRAGRGRHAGRAGCRHRSRALRQADGRDRGRRAAGLRDGRARALQPAVAGRTHPHDDPAVELLHRRRARPGHAEHDAGAGARRRRRDARGFQHRRRPDGRGRFHPDARRRLLREQCRRRSAARSADCSAARAAGARRGGRRPQVQGSADQHAGGGRALGRAGRGGGGQLEESGPRDSARRSWAAAPAAASAATATRTRARSSPRASPTTTTTSCAWSATTRPCIATSARSRRKRRRAARPRPAPSTTKATCSIPKIAGVKIMGGAGRGGQGGRDARQGRRAHLHGRRGERLPEGRVRQGRRLGQEDSRHEVVAARPESAAEAGVVQW